MMTDMFITFVARFHPFLFQRGIRAVRLGRIHSLFRSVSLWTVCSHFFERVCGFEGQWISYPQSLLSLDRVCEFVVA
jgi:hypothetical protein